MLLTFALYTQLFCRFALYCIVAQEGRLSEALEGVAGCWNSPRLCCRVDSMSIEATQGLQDGPTAAVSAQNHRVTARTVRDDDGSTRTIYRVDGHDVGSRAALEAALGGQQ